MRLARLALFGVVLLLALPSVLASTITTFNNSASSESLSMVTNQTITRYLAVPSGTIITSGSFNLTDSFDLNGTIALGARGNASSDVLANTCVKLGGAGCVGYPNHYTFRSSTVGVLENELYFLYNLSRVPTPDRLHNMTFILQQIDPGANPATKETVLELSLNNSWVENTFDWTSKPAIVSSFELSTQKLPASVLSNMTWNITSSARLTSQNMLRFFQNASDGKKLTLNLHWNMDDGTSRSADFSMRANSNATEAVPTLIISYHANYTPSNLVVGVNNAGWNDSAQMGVNQTITSIVSYINNYLSTCTYVGGYCYVPFNFTSAHNGTLTYSGLSFTDTGFIENGQSWNNNTIGLQTEQFSLNLSYNSAYYTGITPTLVWNGTSYAGSVSGTGNNRIVSRSITIPATSTQQNVSFYWAISLTNTTGSVDIFNSTSHNQSISKLSIDNCGTNTVRILNFTLRDEDTQALIAVNSTIQTFVTLTTDSGAQLNVSVAQSNNATMFVCLNSGALTGANYTLDAITSYVATGYVTEFHNIQDALITSTNIPINIDLFDLLTTHSDSFLITYKDENFLPVPGAIIDITRQYISEGVFKSVEVPLTDTYGQAIGHLVSEDAVYSFIVKQNGVVIATFENVIAYCDPTTGACTINLYEFNSGQRVQSFRSYPNLWYDLLFNKTSRTVSSSFTVKDGSTATLNLTVYKFDQNGNSTACSQALVSSSGSLSCTISNVYGNTTVQAVLRMNGNVVATDLFSLSPDAQEVFGPTGLFLQALVLLVLIGMALTSGIATIVFAIIALILGSMIGIVNGGSFFGQASILMWAVVAGMILIFKLSNRRNS